jgi:hypothetical protein
MAPQEYLSWRPAADMTRLDGANPYNQKGKTNLTLTGLLTEKLHVKITLF